MVFQNDILAGASGTAAGYTIDQSIRFNDNDSAYMSRTAGSTGNRQKWTFSAWVKRGNLSSNQRLFHDSGNTNFIMFGFSSNNEFRVYLGADLRTTALFRDPSAWYHLVVAVDTTQATSSDRVKIYQNGVQITSFSASGYPSLNYNTIFNNSGTTYQISGQSVSEYFDGYISEFHWIDGQALDPTSFGEFNDDGVWIAKPFAGEYGSNGFYLKGQDSSNLGDDSSGNGNDFTSSGLTSDDQVTDTPTENYCTLNPLYGAVSYPATFSNGNLTASGSGGVGRYAISTMGATSGKWYSEIKVDSMSTPILFRIVVGGWSNLYDPLLFSAGEAAPQINSVLYMGDGRRRINNSDTVSWGATFTTGDVIGVAYDADTGKVWFAKNNSWQASGNPAAGTNPAATLTTGAPFYSGLNPFDSGTGTVNFGQLGFTYTPPTGFSALSTANLPTPAIADGSTNFNIVLYTGTGNVTRSVTGVGFQPDLVYNKQRNNTSANVIANAVSGANTFMATEQITAESSFTNSIYGYLSSFDSDGYTLTPGSTNNNYWNENAINFVSYNWLAANGTASNSDGDITSTVSVNTTAGFSVLTYSGSGTTNDTVGHGLGVKPSVVIVKPRNASDNWIVNDWSGDYTNKLKLNANEAASSAANFVNAADSTTFTLGSDINVNGSGRTFVAYCWNEVEGFSKFGSYTGNGSADGPFVWCGFRPAFILVKEYTSADDWLVYDTSRDTYNVAGQVWRPDSNAAEFDGRGGSRDMDILSNGFKFRSSNGTMNGSGVGYLFMAFAEHPFGGDGVAPVPAR